MTKIKFFFFVASLLFISAYANAQDFGLISPPNNVKCAPPNIHLAWNAAPGFNYYRVVVATDTNLTNVVYTKDSITILYDDVENLYYSTTYFWQVTAWRTADDSTLVSEIWNFTTLSHPVTTLFPIDSSFCVTKSAKFVWNHDPNAVKYVLQISRVPTFTGQTVTFDTILVDTSKFITNLLSDTRYWWRVRALYGDCEGYWSASKTFRTVPAPMVLVKPVNAAFGVELLPNASQFDVDFAWASVPDANLYNIQITDYIHSDSLLYETTFPDTSITLTLPNFDYNKTYYWRVRAHIVNDSLHCITEFSQWFNFKTPYAAPALHTPSNNATCIDFEQPLFWNKVAGASAYEVIVSSQLDFSDTLHFETNIQDTLIAFPFDRELSAYYWQVRAIDNNNNGYWSAPFTFTTNLFPPDYEYPVDKKGGYPLTVHYVWKSKGNGAKYSLQVSDKIDFSNLIVDVDNLTERTFTVNHTEHFKYYYWRVRAELNGCTSDWSKPFVFRTKLPAPFLQTPENNASDVVHTPTFTWKPVAGASGYEFMLDTKSNFSTAITRSNIPTNELRLVQPLDENTIYYWRVRAINEEGTSDWSSVFTFTTGFFLPETPVLISPENESKKHPINGLKLVWHSAHRAQTYQLQVTNLADFSQQLVVNVTDLIDTTYILNNLENYTVYLFRVRAVNQGGFSDWSVPFAFRTINIPPTTPPDLTIPANGATNQPLGLRISWLPVQRAEGYSVQVATDENFQNFFVNEPDVYLTYLNLFNLSPGTKYYWRVKAWNEAGEGDWSAPYHFTTMELTSVSDNLLNKFNLNVYPNPANSQLHFSFEHSKDGFADIAIYNLNGIKVSAKENNFVQSGSNSIKFDVSSLPSGIYLWQIKIDGEILSGYLTIAR